MNEAQLERYFENFCERRKGLEDGAQRDRAAGIVPDTDYLVFSVGEEEFAAPMSQVFVTMAVPRCTSLPFLPAYHKGIANVRGRVVSVVDLRVRMGAEPHMGSETALVVVDQDGDWLGIVVDSVNRVLSVKSIEELRPVRAVNILSLFEGAKL